MEEEEEEEEGAPARPARRRPRPEVAGGGGGDRTQPRNEVTAAISEDEFSELVATIDRETSKGKEEWKGRGPAGDYCLLWPSFPPSLLLYRPLNRKSGERQEKFLTCVLRRHRTPENLFPKENVALSAQIVCLYFYTNIAVCYTQRVRCGRKARRFHINPSFNLNCMLRLIHRESGHFWSIGRSS